MVTETINKLSKNNTWNSTKRVILVIFIITAISSAVWLFFKAGNTYSDNLRLYADQLKNSIVKSDVSTISRQIRIEPITYILAGGNTIIFISPFIFYLSIA